MGGKSIITSFGLLRLWQKLLIKPMNSIDYFFQSLASIKGVGAKNLSFFAKLFRRKEDIPIYKDLIFHLPHTILKINKNPDLAKVEPGENIIIKTEVLYFEEVPLRSGIKKYYRIVTKADNRFLNLIFFNAKKAYLEQQLPIGSTKVICGKIEQYNGKLQITHPSHILPETSFTKTKDLQPIYPLTEGISNKFLSGIIARIIYEMPELEEWQDTEFKRQNNFLSLKKSLYEIHSPNNSTAHMSDSNYRRRLEYDELLANQLALAISRGKVAKQQGNIIDNERALIKALLKQLQFSLTEAQISALKEISTDLKSANKMFRLVQGDVGSGKTIVGLITLINVIESGYQSAFMAPTEILARQQYESLNQIISGNAILQEAIKPVVIVGGLKQSEKAKIQLEISEGKYNLIFGTHALFQEKVSFKNLGAIVIDEQHRFGVTQRMQLAHKGDKTHILLMTATPIPRTLSMTIYGDMDVSIINEKPAGRKPIDTRIIPVSKTGNLVESLKQEVAQGSQIYWVCPAVEEKDKEFFNNENRKLASAEERFKTLKKIFKDKVVLVHGKLKADKKNKAVEKFREGKASIMVATTVIEVGVNVPTANVIIIENAEMFGLSQLHQLRGRVGRGKKQSSCILLYGKTLSENGAERLKILRETEDGFKIAEEDMVLRGSGDLLGTKQSGMPDFKIATLPNNKDLLFAARDQVKIILNKDPSLKSEQGKNLRNLLYLFEYDNLLNNLNA